MLSRKLQRIVPAVHGTVVVHHLRQDAYLRHAAQPAEIVGGLGVPWPLEHAAGPGAQGEHVARLGERIGLVRQVAECSCGRRPVGRRYPSGRAWNEVRGDIEVRGIRVCVPAGGGVEPEEFQALPLRRDAHDAGCMSNDERHLLRCHGLGCAYQVALVLPVVAVHDHDQLAPAKRGDCVIHGRPRHGTAQAAMARTPKTLT
mmetsp:Transcript_86973/g.235696  ORF Transcript_86973/g.235696 Transcript_86973/m.235696 type:complete len:201 (+) Transcript_86973:493-1095(+)